MSRYLIINADDFGYNPQQNAAITDLLSEGLITSTSVMAVAPSAEDCAVLDGNAYSVGVHLTLNSDGVSSPWHSLTGAGSIGGERGLPADGKDLTFGAKRKDVRAELDAQYDYLLSRGVTVDHADNHCGTLYGINGRRFYIDAFDFCAERHLPFRFPKTPGFAERQLGRPLPAAAVRLLNAIAAKGKKRGVKMPDDIVSDPRGIDKIGGYDDLRAYYLNAIDNCADGITEMFLHPAQPSGGETGPWSKRILEYRLLKSGDLLQRAREKDVQVVSWKIFDELP